MSGPVTFALAVGLTYLLVVPVLVFGHELAHAAVGLALLPGTVRISIGTERRWEWTIGRLEVGIDPAGWRTWWPGFYRPTAAPEGYGGAAIALIGPISSFVTAVALFVAASTSAGVIEDIYLLGASWAAIQVVMTAVPMTYPGWMAGYAGDDSDGKRAIRYLRD